MARAPTPAPPPEPSRDQLDALNATQLAALILGKGGPSGDPTADPKGGFSYLDNIASVLLGDRDLPGNGPGGNQVLINQLLGREEPRDSFDSLRQTPGYGTNEPYNVPTGTTRPHGPPMGTDIPGVQRMMDMLLGTHNIGTDPTSTQGARNMQDLLDNVSRKRRS